MLNINKVLLAGNLTRDVELKTLPSGSIVGNFGMAINNRRSDGQEETVFVDITCWNKTAENCSKFIGKGSNVFIEGVLQMESWQGQDGKKNTKLKVTAMSVQFVSRKNDDQHSTQSAEPNPYAAAPQGNTQYNMPSYDQSRRGMYARTQTQGGGYSGHQPQSGGVNPAYGPEDQAQPGGELPPF